MRAACWGSGLDSSPLLRLACLQAGRRQHCQPRQVRKKAAVTAAAGCPAHKSHERENVRGFLRLQHMAGGRYFLGSRRTPIHGNSFPKASTKGNSLSCKKTSRILTKYSPRTTFPKNKKALPEDRQGQQDLHVTTAVRDRNKSFWKGGGSGGGRTFSPKRFPSPRKHPSPP